MKMTLDELWAIKVALNKEMYGVDLTTGNRTKAPDLRLPVSMKRHLRRVLEEVDSATQIAEPERTEFIEKWVKDVEGEKVLPKPEDENYADYRKEELEVFHQRDCVIAFQPFHLELLDTLNEVIPGDVESIMNDLNNEYKRQLEAEKPLTEGDKNVVS